MIAEALNAPTLDEAIAIVDVSSKDNEELEDLAWTFAFWNGDSRIPPSEREDALAGVCLDELDRREAADGEEKVL